MPEYEHAQQLLKQSGWTGDYRCDLEKTYSQLFREIFRIKRNRTLVKGFRNIKPELEKYCGIRIDMGYESLTFSLGYNQVFEGEQSRFFALRDFLGEDIIQIGHYGTAGFYMNMAGVIYQTWDINSDHSLYIMDNILQLIESNYLQTVEERPAIDIQPFMASAGIPVWKIGQATGL